MVLDTGVSAAAPGASKPDGGVKQKSPALVPTKAGPSPAEGERHALATAGAFEVWSVASGDGSDILARVAGAKSPARILRHTTGEVGELRAVADDQRVWVAWASTSNRAEFVAALYADKTLANATVPVTLTLTGAGGLYNAPPSASLGIALWKSGIVVVHLAGRSKCTFGPGTEVCPQYGVTVVDDQLAATPLATRSVSGGPDITVSAPLTFASGIAISAYAWHGGPVVDNVFLPDNGTPAKSLPSCRPPNAMQKFGEKLVITCNDYPSKGETCPVHEDDLCGRIVALDPMSPPPPFRLLTKEPIEAQAKRF